MKTCVFTTLACASAAVIGFAGIMGFVTSQWSLFAPIITGVCGVWLPSPVLDKVCEDIATKSTHDAEPQVEFGFRSSSEEDLEASWPAA